MAPVSPLRVTVLSTALALLVLGFLVARAVATAPEPRSQRDIDLLNGYRQDVELLAAIIPRLGPSSPPTCAQVQYELYTRKVPIEHGVQFVGDPNEFSTDGLRFTCSPDDYLRSVQITREFPRP